ncbi:hypothetical protein Misp01_52860 [Microtetraspora sp. NBRC 13810]|uniref:hypothetical protein n=1 Tax=Microtetraspora sp. NBRC 13810 TaxID=3030990 RepID=UPI002555307C|nr:hypothetical protein [Microtetraspora sp. NBRC 13810]GLW10157.1 hypothetical protein Misp01_52860 [Microtetraspora sp. NBRC 13810]
MSGFGTRVVLVPDLGEELVRAVGELEGVLVRLRAAEDAGAVLPGALAGGAALVSLRRLWRAVAPSQGRYAVAAGLAGRLYSPGGRVELVPLRLVDVDPLDVATLSATAAGLGAAVLATTANAAGAAGADGYDMGVVREALEAGRGPGAGAGLVTVAARISGLLDLADTAESILLREHLAAAGPGADVVLAPAVEQAYLATARRIATMWPPPGTPATE